MGLLSDLFTSGQKKKVSHASSGPVNDKYQKMRAEQEYQDRLLQRVNTAWSRYQSDGNIDAVIREFEYAFVTSKPACISSQCTKLVDLYMKAGRVDDAWKYLNQLAKVKGVHRDWVRGYQAKIAKQEGRDKDAIDLYMRSHLLKAKEHGSYTRSTFLRDISGPARRLGLTKDDKEHLADIIDGQIRCKTFTEQSIRQKFNAFLKERDI